MSVLVPSRWIGVLILSLLLTSLPLVSKPARACQVELVLAMDVSRSVNPAEFHLIRHGTAEALRNETIIELIGWMKGGILVTVTQWSGPEQQRQMVPWKLLTDAVSIRAFADDIDDMKRIFRFGFTAPGEALLHADALAAEAPVTCRRRVIDIAGDGIRNAGLDAAIIATAIAARGVTINGLVVRGDSPDPLEFYHTDIKRGTMAFVEISNGFDDYPEAIFRKLLRELSPSLSELRQ